MSPLRLQATSAACTASLVELEGRQGGGALGLGLQAPQVRVVLLLLLPVAGGVEPRQRRG